MYERNLAHYVVVTGILVQNEKFLIVKRSNKEKAFPGRWSVPGGKLEVLDYCLKNKDTASHWYNTFEDVLKREVKEEVGINIKNIGYVTSMVYIRSDNIPCVIVSMFAEPQENEQIKLDSCLTEFVWVNLEEAKEYDLIEGIYEELTLLDSKSEKKVLEQWKKQE